jgi:acyl-CoA thioester hydrolase
MKNYIKSVPLRWSDMDPNFHLRHSAFYDMAATLRLDFLAENGLTMNLMAKEHFGPIIFREECIFKKEIRYGDDLKIDLQVTKLRRDYSRFSFQHHFFTDGDKLCAILNIDGAWMDTKLRKLTIPPPIAIEMSEQLPKSADFTWTD